MYHLFSKASGSLGLSSKEGGMSAFGQIFSKDTQAIFYNWKPSPVQRMLDFDFLCGEFPKFRRFLSDIEKKVSE